MRFAPRSKTLWAGLSVFTVGVNLHFGRFLRFVLASGVAETPEITRGTERGGSVGAPGRSRGRLSENCGLVKTASF